MNQGKRWSWSDEARQRASDRQKEKWADPEMRERHRLRIIQALDNPVTRQRLSDSMKRRWADPAMRQQLVEGIIRAKADPTASQNRSEARKRDWADPEKRQRKIESLRRAQPDSAIRQRKSEAMNASHALPRTEGKSQAHAGRVSPLSRKDGELMCRACVRGKCLLCDGEGCRCVCAVELDKKRVQARWTATTESEGKASRG